MRKPIRFSLRSLGIVVTLLCIVLGAPITYIRQDAQNQQRSVARLRKLNTSILHQPNAAPDWITKFARRWIHENSFERVGTVTIAEDPHNLDEKIDCIVQLTGLGGLTNHSPRLNDQHLTKLATIPTLENLRLFDGDYSHAGIQALLRRRGWRIIQTPKASFNDAMLKDVSRSPNLHSLDIDLRSATPEGFRAIAACPSLKVLRVTQCKDVGSLATALRKAPQLRFLVLVDTQVSQSDLKAIGLATQLTSLEFEDCQMKGPALEQLTGLTQLKNLDLSSCPIHPDEIQALSEFPLLKGLSLRDGVDDSNIDFVHRLSFLRVLVLSKTELSDEGLQKLSGSKLSYLFLPEDSSCTVEGIREIQKTIPIRVIVGAINEGTHYLPDGTMVIRGK
jgi:hypothetical protein